MDGAYFIYLPLVDLRFEIADYECYSDDTERDKLARTHNHPCHCVRLLARRWPPRRLRVHGSNIQ